MMQLYTEPLPESLLKFWLEHWERIYGKAQDQGGCGDREGTERAPSGTDGRGAETETTKGKG